MKQASAVLFLVLAAASPFSVNHAFSQTQRFSDVDPYLGDAVNWKPLTASRWSVVTDGGDLRYGIHTTNYSGRPTSRLGEYSLVRGRTYGDFSFSARVRSSENLAANANADHAVVFGLQDASNYYYAMFNRTAAGTQLFKVVGGVRQPALATASYAIPDNNYHLVGVTRSGTLITVSVDGVPIMRADDATFGAGRVGIGAFNDAAWWDDIAIAAATSLPSVSLSAAPAAISPGQSATLSWSSTNATSCAASDGWSGTLATSGSRAMTPSATATYIVTCSGPGGVASQSVMVTVTAPPQVPVVSVSASPASITSGQSATLTWSSTNAASCTASGGWSGAKATSGSQAVNPSSTATYVVSCTGAGGSASQSATVTVAASGAITPSLVTSRVSGVAPLYVFFDATGTSATATTRPFHELEYQWNFGDPASGLWTSTPGMPNLSRDQATGPVAAHVYETPGTYTVSLTVLDGTSTAGTSVQITVTDPDEVFTANTLCVGNSQPVAGSGGCPAGAAVLASSDFDAAINNNIASRKRILFRRSDTFTSSASANIRLNGPGLIGAFGTGARPIVNVTGNNKTFMLSSGSTPGVKDWRIMDLEINGNSGAASAGIYAEGGIDQVTLLRLNIHHVHWGVHLSPSVLDYYGGQHRLWDQFAMVDSTIQYAIGGAGGYCLYVGGQRFALMGNVFSDSSASEHVLRTPNIVKAVISHNDMSNAAPTKHVIKLQAAVFNVSPTGFTEQVVLSDNKFSGGAGVDWTVTIGPENAQSDEKVRNVIVERNWFAPHSGQSVAMVLWAQDVTVRNNLFNLTGTAGRMGMLVERRGVEPPPANVHVYNNTFYSNSAGSFSAIQFAEGAGMVAKNNLGYAPLSTSRVMVSGSAINDNNSSNTDLLLAPGFTLPAPVAPADFALGVASYVVDDGTAAPVFSDFFRLGRPHGGALDVGAAERP